jgi:hypothetical protein
VSDAELLDILEMSDPSPAVFSPCRKYRYTLWRRWGDLFNANDKYVMFIGLNPSTADEISDDPTIRKCRGFAQRWGYSAMVMTNLFAFRATDPKVMKQTSAPIGEDNDHYLRLIATNADRIIAAWGANGPFRHRDQDVIRIIPKGIVECLRKTKHGHPEHPLYVPYDVVPVCL